MTVVLHDGHRFELVTRDPGRHHPDAELVLQGLDGSCAGTVEIHLEPNQRAEVMLFVHPTASRDEAGTVLLSEAADYAARHGAVQLFAPHRAGDPHAAAIVEGTGLAYEEQHGLDGPTTVIDLRPLLAWQALTSAGV